MKEIVADTSLIAYCGLYCGACKKYSKGKCPGCMQNEKATWCTVRSCCQEHNYSSCADCTLKPLEECKEFNSFMAKMFGVIFRSDRAACVKLLREQGREQFAEYMAKNRHQSIRT